MKTVVILACNLVSKMRYSSKAILVKLGLSHIKIPLKINAIDKSVLKCEIFLSLFIVSFKAFSL